MTKDTKDVLLIKEIEEILRLIDTLFVLNLTDEERI